MVRSVSSKQRRPKKPTTKKLSARQQTFGGWFSQWCRRQIKRQRDFLSRRPHRSFRLTKRRDYKRSLKLPGYWLLTSRVWKLFWSHKWLFLGLSVLYAALTLLLAVIMSQDTYNQLRDMVNEAHQEGLLNGVLAVGTIFFGVILNQLTGNSSGGSQQQVIGLLIGLFVWLTTIWLARSLAADKRPKIRDGLYRSGGPVIALLVLVFVVVIQSIPAAIALLLYSSADSSGLLAQTVILMLAGGATILIVVLSLYWAVSTLFAMIIVTLPGMYPMEALKLAGDIVVGRRLRILLRIVWLILLLLIMAATVIVPAILCDTFIHEHFASWSWLPIVPVVALVTASISIVFSALYVYSLYRKIVEDDAAPAKN